MTPSLKQKGDFKNSLSLLKIYLDNYENGNPLMYLPMAVELRKLLAEKQGYPLLEQLIPDIELHKFHSTDFFEKNPNLLAGLQQYMPGRLSFNEKNIAVFNFGFSQSREKMTLALWMNQMLFREGVTIFELIKSVADKEAAHSDKNYNDTLQHCKNWSFNDVECHILGIYALSRYIFDFVTIENSEILT